MCHFDIFRLILFSFTHELFIVLHRRNRIMQLSEANVADILRLHQHDESFVRQLQDNIQTIAKLFGPRNYHGLQKNIPIVTNAWYYFMTTLGKLQTLGEEYTGTIRLDNNRRIPTKWFQLLWLALYIGGEPLFERLINATQRRVRNSTELTEQAKSVLLNTSTFLQSNKEVFKRIHHSLFYIDGKYYNISNRITGIKYALVRHWMLDETYTSSFRYLGYFTLFYTLFNFIQQIWNYKSNGNVNDNFSNNTMIISKRGCILCAENRRNPCATPCGHVFCWDCIYDSLKYQETCPICREIVLPNRIIFLQNYL